jgi:hypothetical protein
LSRICNIFRAKATIAASAAGSEPASPGDYVRKKGDRRSPADVQVTPALSAEWWTELGAVLGVGDLPAPAQGTDQQGGQRC